MATVGYDHLMMRAGAAHDVAYVLSRVHAIRNTYQPWMRDRARIRDIINGGRPGVIALFGADTKYRESDIPAANFIDTGLERTGQKLGQMPDLKIDPPLGVEGPRKRYDADVLTEVVTCYDEMGRLGTQLPYQARWLIGYGYCVWVMGTRADPISGHWYPVGRMRNAFDCYPGPWDADDDPTELVVTRQVEAAELMRRYPGFAKAWTEAVSKAAGSVLASYQAGSLSSGNPTDPVTVHEFYDITGCYYICEETGTVLDFWPNPLDTPPFVVARRVTFDALGGAYQHVIGLQSMIAKLNLLSFIATEDGVFRATNIIGDMAHTTYRFGRRAINHFPPGVQIQKEQIDGQLFQAFSQIDRLERGLRVGANYPQTADAESPLSFATGQGLGKLQMGFEGNIDEYQRVLTPALQRLDSLRLSWDEYLYSGLKKPLYANIDGEVRQGTYDPARIKGWYRTRRVYGMMASWDEPEKIVGGLQLMAAEVIDPQTLQENLNGLEQISRINERIKGKKAEETLFTVLQSEAANGDPRARLVLVEIAADPARMTEILREHYTPEEPAETPELQNFLAQMGAGGMGGGGGASPAAPPPDVTTILSRLEGGGEVGGGSQTVAQV